MLIGIFTSVILLSAPAAQVAPGSIFPAQSISQQSQLIEEAPQKLLAPALPEYLSVRLSDRVQIDAVAQSYASDIHEASLNISILF